MVTLSREGTFGGWIRIFFIGRLGFRRCCTFHVYGVASYLCVTCRYWYLSVTCRYCYLYVICRYCYLLGFFIGIVTCVSFVRIDTCVLLISNVTCVLLVGIVALLVICMSHNLYVSYRCREFFLYQLSVLLAMSLMFEDIGVKEVIIIIIRYCTRCAHLPTWTVS